jgi:hypothetical protein
MYSMPVASVRRAADDQMVEHRLDRRSGAVIAEPGSSGEEIEIDFAPFGRGTNTCQIRSLLLDGSVFDALRIERRERRPCRPVAENAMWSITPARSSSADVPPTMCSTG